LFAEFAAAPGIVVWRRDDLAPQWFQFLIQPIDELLSGHAHGVPPSKTIQTVLAVQPLRSVQSLRSVQGIFQYYILRLAVAQILNHRDVFHHLTLAHRE